MQPQTRVAARLTAIARPLSAIATGVLAPASLLTLVILGFAVGALRLINSWDYPTYLAIAFGAAALVELPRLRGGAVWGVGRLLLSAAILVAVSTLAFQPFHTSYELFYAGVHPAEERTPVSQYINVHMLFLFLVLSYLGVELARLYGRSTWVRTARIGLAHWDELPRVQSILSRIGRSQTGAASPILVLASVPLVVVAGLFLIGYQTVAFLLLLLTMIAAVAVRDLGQGGGAPVRLFVLILVAAAFALGIGVDVITLDGDIQRMNTVFKFYLQAWTLLSIAGAFAGWIVIREIAAWRVRRRSENDRAASWVVRGWLAGLAVLGVAVVLYPIFATPIRIQDRFLQLPPTWDGAAFMRAATFQDEKGPIQLGQDYLAIRWLQDHIYGSPVILEAPAGPPPHMPLYRWAGRVSIHTGLPTVLGWDWHQSQQRWAYRSEIETRLRDAAMIYQTPNWAIAESLLRKYDVSYIYVGPVERLYFQGPGLVKFQRQLGLRLDSVYDEQGVTIYRVLGA